MSVDPFGHPDPSMVDHLVDLHEAIVRSVPSDTSIDDVETGIGFAESSGETNLAGMISCLRLLEQVRRDERVIDLVDPVIPGNIGRFRVIRWLGQGTYGLVYLADDPALGRKVAIKIPRPEVIITPSLKERFLREASFAAGLDHESILRVYEAGQADGLSYIVSAYCQGPTLAEWIHNNEPLDHADAAQLIATLAEAVHFAHTRGVIHRDLKPSNILLDIGEHAGDSDECHQSEALLANRLPEIARISDFGLAKIDRGQDTTLTRSGAIVGTPAYMSPEQAAGDLTAVGTLSDIHALGVMLYELLVGKPPFKESTVVATLESVRTYVPVSPRRSRPEIPADLSAICMKCLEKEPADRYASADELARDLQCFLSGRSVTACSTGPLTQAWRWTRRNPLVATLAGGLFLTIVAIAIGSTIAAQRFQFQRDLAEANLGRAVTAEGELKQTIQHLEARLTEYSHEEMVSLQTKVIEANPNAFDAYYERGENHWVNGNYDLAIADFAKVMEIAPTFPWAKADTAWIYLVGPPEMRDVETALKLCEGTVDMAPHNWSLQFTQGLAFYRAGDFEKALPHLEEGISLRDDGGNSLHLFFYAMTLHQLGREKEALQAWENALTRLTQTQWEIHDREVKPVQEECRQLLFGT